jgi:formylglycine-generating enzyme required for sulfatase activity
MKLPLFLIAIFLFPVDVFGVSSGMALIPAGEISREASTQSIHLDSFYIDKTEVTQIKFKQIMGDTKFFFKGDNHPAEQISWYKAKAYCEKIGKRLPSELEWEKAAKGGSNTKYYWGKKPEAKYSWFGGDYDLGHHPVAKKQPNLFGLFDTSGNVWEWTATTDNLKSKYSEEIHYKRVAKGGAFNVSANLITSNSRLSLHAKNRLFNVGFRCAK